MKNRIRMEREMTNTVTGNLAPGLLEIGWEAWTRTRIARFRVWSPTDWTTSQPREEQKGIATPSRGSGQPRFTLSNLVGIQESVNRAPLLNKLGDPRESSLFGGLMDEMRSRAVRPERLYRPESCGLAG